MRSKLAESVDDGPRRWTLLALGLTVVLVDATCFTTDGGAQSPWRIALGLGALVAYLALCRWRGREIGLGARPEPSLRFWVIAIAVLAALSLLLLAAAGAWLWIRDQPLPASIFRSAADVWWSFRTNVLQAPLSEELIYRLALCVPLVVVLGPWAAILVSGAMFAYLHVLYGNFAFNHVAAGFILSWSYVRSGCLWLPIALHAMGNLLVLLVNVALMRWGG